MKKRWISLLIALALVLACLPPPARAEEAGAVIGGEEITLRQGETAELWINAEGFGEIAAIDFGVYSENLEIVSADAGYLLYGSVYDCSFSTDAALFSAVASGTFGDSGALAFLTVQAPEELPEGIYWLDLTVGDVWGADLQPRTVSCSPVKVTVLKKETEDPPQTLRIIAGGPAPQTMGEEFTLSFAADYIRDLGTFSLTAEYDYSLLRLKSVVLSELLTGAELSMVSVNDSIPGCVKVSYLTGAGVSGNIDPLISFTFEVIQNTDDYTVVSLEADSVYEISGKAIRSTSDSAVITLYSSSTEPQLPKIRLTPVTEDRNTLTLRATAEQETAIAAGDFVVSYDIAELSCTAVTPGGTGLLYSNVLDADGTVKFSFILDGGITKDTVLCTLSFAKKNCVSCGNTPITLTGKHVVNNALAPVEVEYVGASAAVHNYNTTQTPPTCTTLGYTTYTCAVCGDSYADTYVPALGHDWSEWTIATEPSCTQDGETTRVCGRCGTVQTRALDALGHELVDHAAKAPTCTEIGWDAYQTCTRCDYTTYAEQPALGHDLVDHARKTPTCTEIGWNAYQTCTRCDYTTYAELPALGHELVDHAAKAPTCTEIGWDAYQTCTRCDYTTYNEFPALGHELVDHAAKAPTCTEIGWDAYQTCTRCDYTTYAELPASGHSPAAAVEENYDPPTCTETGGYDVVIYCSVCHAELGREHTELSATGHSYELSGWSWMGYESAKATFICKNDESHVQTVDAAITSVRTDPTAEENGSVVYTAKVIFENKEYTDSRTEILPPLGHEYEFSGFEWDGFTSADAVFRDKNSTQVLRIEAYITCVRKEPGCVTDGSAVWTASVIFEEREYTDVQTETLSALGHDLIDCEAQAPTCTEFGWDAYQVCTRCDYSTFEALPALGHDLIDHEGKAPTCTTVGWDAYQTCTRCDYTTCEEVPALGHDLIDHAGKAPTCTANGWNAYQTCTRCDYTTYAEVPALGHNLIDHAGKAPTCTAVGWDAYQTCSRCDYTNYTELPAPGHELIDHAAKAPTCTAVGWDAYQSCTRCDFTTFAELPTLGHDLVGHAAKAPTCTAIGWNAYQTCTRCDYTTYTELPALGHDLIDHEAKAPTCTEIGWDAYQTCAYCDYSTYVELPALEHRFENGVCTVCGAKDPDYKPTVSFVDVPEEAFYYNAVLWAVAHDPQVTAGTDATHFSPNSACTRGQVVTFLWRANGCPEPMSTTHPFTDVKESGFYYKAMLWAVENGITTGASKTTFAPGKPCTRGQVVTFLWRAQGSPAPKTTTHPFTDVNESGYYFKAMLWAVENGVTTGASKTTFAPDKSCTRGQVVTFLYRAEGGK